MALISAYPNPSTTGRPVTIIGQGFGNAVEVTFEISPGGFKSEIVCTAAGAVSTSGIADHATGTLTSTGQPVAGETFTLDTRVYTMRANVATMVNPYDVLIGAAATNTLDNIVAAVNGDRAGLGVVYGAGTVAHPTVFAGGKTSTTVVFYARIPGSANGQNSIATTETLTTNAFGGGTLAGGASGAAQAMLWVPPEEGTYTVTATDGTNTATPLQVQIYTS